MSAEYYSIDPMKEADKTLLEIADIVSALYGTISGPKDFDQRCKWLREQMDAYATAKAQASCEATPVSAPSESQQEPMFTVEDMEKCFEMGCIFGRDMVNNPSNTEYVRGLYELRKQQLTRKPE